MKNLQTEDLNLVPRSHWKIDFNRPGITLRETSSKDTINKHQPTFSY